MGELNQPPVERHPRVVARVIADFGDPFDNLHMEPGRNPLIKPVRCPPWGTLPHQSRNLPVIINQPSVQFDRAEIDQSDVSIVIDDLGKQLADHRAQMFLQQFGDQCLADHRSDIFFLDITESISERTGTFADNTTAMTFFCKPSTCPPADANGFDALAYDLFVEEVCLLYT